MLDLKQSVFKWEDLNGKNLNIMVHKEDNQICVTGFCKENFEVYVLYSGVNK
jgi:hypothetical protein